MGPNWIPLPGDEWSPSLDGPGDGLADTMLIMQLPVGRTIDVRDFDSLGPAFKKGEPKCGVYRLHFENRKAYQGQSRNVVRRFAGH